MCLPHNEPMRKSDKVIIGICCICAIILIISEIYRWLS